MDDRHELYDIMNKYINDERITDSVFSSTVDYLFGMCPDHHQKSIYGIRKDFTKRINCRTCRKNLGGKI